ncbi:MAG: hypothetical protein HKM93_13375 [Desulfobacteraceae bacterium]|nr:hypothetical protein [Desulfobacteraceae bacterium]
MNKTTRPNSWRLLGVVVLAITLSWASMTFAAVGPFKEVNGRVVIEAENYHFKTTNGKKRDFYLFPNTSAPKPDPDGPHTSGASNGKYLEILPDTRVTHDDPLIPNVNLFASGSNAPQLHYKVKISNSGRYYVWARVYSTGPEDNGVHVGYDGKWPTSGTAMQWCTGKNKWTWSSQRRLPENHCGVPLGIYLDLTAGEHTIMFGMREDGFEFDRFLLVKDRTYRPTGAGPAESPRTDGGGTPTNEAPTVNAGPDQAVQLSAPANLNGSAYDDGLPSNNLTTTWRKVSGPGIVKFGNVSALNTTATFSLKGFYVLSLAASDGVLSTSDRIGINVRTTNPDPVNQAPAVNAGPDQTIGISEMAALSGSASDDGKPNNTLTTTWSKVSGPGNVTVENKSALKTRASFSAEGFYVLQLSADDGALKSSDRVGINVSGQVTQEGAFVQSGQNGLVVFEAESNQENISSADHDWIKVNKPANFSGSGAMEAIPDQGERIVATRVRQSPHLEFKVSFVETGRHFVWIRGLAQGNDNSLHVGLGGKTFETARNITLPVVSDWRWNNTSNGNHASINVTRKGIQTVDLWMREDGLIVDKIILTTDPTYEPSGKGPAESPFSDGGSSDIAFNQGNDDQGFAVMETENYDTNKAAGAHKWTEVYVPSNISGNAAMSALPDIGARINKNYTANSPSLNFKVKFVKTGRHYIWLRGLASGNDNSCHVGLDGSGIVTSQRMEFPISRNLVWTGRVNGNVAYIDVTKTGTHTINVWMREDGLTLDKILITINPDYVPTGSGPVESVRK